MTMQIPRVEQHENESMCVKKKGKEIFWIQDLSAGIISSVSPKVQH